jgi:predicted flap endonuclease-1-like 5' DNA nuclease
MIRNETDDRLDFLVPGLGRVYISRGDAISARHAAHVPPEARDRLALDVELRHLDGIGPARGWDLAEVGIYTMEELLAADAAELADEAGIEEDLIADWQAAAEAQLAERDDDTDTTDA